MHYLFVARFAGMKFNDPGIAVAFMQYCKSCGDLDISIPVSESDLRNLLNSFLSFSETESFKSMYPALSRELIASSLLSGVVACLLLIFFINSCFLLENL